MQVSAPNPKTVIQKSGLNFASTKGIQFNGGTLFSAYQEGTFTPTDGSGASLVLTGVQFFYRRIGNAYMFWGELVYPSTADGSAAKLNGFPFTAKTTTMAVGGWYTPVLFSNGLFGGGNTPVNLSALSNSLNTEFRNSVGVSFTNANFSTCRMFCNSQVPL